MTQVCDCERFGAEGCPIHGFGGLSGQELYDEFLRLQLETATCPACAIQKHQRRQSEQFRNDVAEGKKILLERVK